MDEQTILPSAQRRTESALAPFGRLRDEIDRLFDDFSFARPPRSIFAFPGRAELTPAMELAPTDDGYELSVELPGIEEKDIDVEFADGSKFRGASLMAAPVPASDVVLAEAGSPRDTRRTGPGSASKAATRAWSQSTAAGATQRVSAT